jgi:hypothetical protein
VAKTLSEVCTLRNLAKDIYTSGLEEFTLEWSLQAVFEQSLEEWE